jgi:hypothetical protein
MDCLFLWMILGAVVVPGVWSDCVLGKVAICDDLCDPALEEVIVEGVVLDGSIALLDCVPPHIHVSMTFFFLNDKNFQWCR